MILRAVLTARRGESEKKMLKTVFVVYVAGVEKCWVLSEDRAKQLVEEFRHSFYGMVHVKESFYYKKEVRKIS